MLFKINWTVIEIIGIMFGRYHKSNFDTQGLDL